MTAARKVAAEGLGTAFLLAAVVGSGVMAERLSGGNMAVALLANALVTGAALTALILLFGPVSGAHFNPVATLASAGWGGMPWREVPGYLLAQFSGALIGVAAANRMFDLPLFFASRHAREGASQLFSEGIATFGLVGVIRGVSRSRPSAVPFAVAAWISAGIWFTASTSFANPAVTVARAFSDTFTGIRPQDVLGFVLAQCVGAYAAVRVFRWLMP